MKTMTLEQIQAMWDRWQEAPEWADYFARSLDGDRGFIRGNRLAEYLAVDCIVEPRPPAAIGVLLGENKRLRDMHKRNAESSSHNFEHQERDHRCGWRVMYEAVVERSKAAIAGEQE